MMRPGKHVEMMKLLFLFGQRLFDKKKLKNDKEKEVKASV
jgi:hypothetical protein